MLAGSTIMFALCWRAEKLHTLPKKKKTVENWKIFRSCVSIMHFCSNDFHLIFLFFSPPKTLPTLRPLYLSISVCILLSYSISLSLSASLSPLKPSILAPLAAQQLRRASCVYRGNALPALPLPRAVPVPLEKQSQSASTLLSFFIWQFA